MANKQVLATIAAATSVLILAACGGGGSGGGYTPPQAPPTPAPPTPAPPTPAPAPAPPAAPGTPTVAGTVTGFGSVFIDGVRIDDRGIAAQTEDASGSVVKIELKIGQTVEIQHDGNLKAKQVLVVPAVQGVISAIDSAAGSMTVLGMAVIINTNRALGPVTVFEAPYTFSSAKAGDGVEIYGILKTDAAGKVQIHATRVEKETLGSTHKLRGKVAALSTSGSTFKIGELTFNYLNVPIKPASASLSNGADVVVSIPATASLTNGAISVTAVKVKHHREESRDAEAQLRGIVSNINVSAKTFALDGLLINAGDAKFDHAGKSFADLSMGAYVRVKGVFQTDGSVNAKSVTLRSIETDKVGEVELHGSILDFVSSADFSVRGLRMNATGAEIDCPSGTVLKNGLQVKIEGFLAADGSVKVKEVECEQLTDGSATVEREGVAGTVNSDAKTFILTGSAAVNVKWNDATLFVDSLTPATMGGKKLEVEGVVTGGVLTAAKIKLDD